MGHPISSAKVVPAMSRHASRMSRPNRLVPPLVPAVLSNTRFKQTFESTVLFAPSLRKYGLSSVHRLLQKELGQQYYGLRETTVSQIKTYGAGFRASNGI